MEVKSTSSGKMLRIPAGAFLRGSREGTGMPDEHPQAVIVVSEFEIDEVPVTWMDFGRFVEAGGYQNRDSWSEEGWEACRQGGWDHPRFYRDPAWSHVTGDHQPVCGVSFWEAQAYARFVGKRLPTEAEWEKAARGTDGRTFPWGNEWEEGRCSTRGEGPRAAPDVGRFPKGASPFGAMDMAGGVWEWCSDWYQPDYFSKAPGVDPPGPDRGDMKVARGGAWNALPLQNRTSNRNAWKPTARFSNLGFRCAR